MMTAKKLFKAQYIAAKAIAFNMPTVDLRYYVEEEHPSIRTFTAYVTRILRKELRARDAQRDKVETEQNRLAYILADALKLGA